MAENKALSIGLLVSNRIGSIEKCLSSLMPLKNAGIAEIIAVDTIGPECSDGSLAIAEKYADKVFHFDWVNDFSAARNATLTPATGEWFMYLDDDEWFDDVSEILDFFKTGEYKNYSSATYIQRNYTERDGSAYGEATVARMCKRTKSLCFEGRIHEHFNYLRLPCKTFSDFVHHYGYIYNTEEERIAHHKRNVPLLELEIKDSPKDLRLRTQMALELSTFDNERALDYLIKTLEEFKESVSDPNYQWLLTLRFPLYEALGYDVFTAEREYSHLEGLEVLNTTAEAAANYALMRLCLINGDAEQAIRHIDKYLSSINILKNDEELRFKEDAVDFRRFTSAEYEKNARDYLKYCEANMIQTTVKSEGLEKLASCTDGDRIPDLILALSPEDFKASMDALIESTEHCFDAPELLNLLSYFENAAPVRYLYLLYKMSETELIRAAELGLDGTLVSNLLVESVSAGRKMYEMIYTPESLSEKGIVWLSDECRFNAILSSFIHGPQTDFNPLLDAARIRPVMARPIKVWIGNIVTGRPE